MLDKSGAKLSEIALTYTDSTRTTLLSNKSIIYNGGATTTTTINYNPNNPNGACNVTTETTSLDGKTLIQKVDSNADGKIDSTITTTTDASGNKTIKTDKDGNGTIDSSTTISSLAKSVQLAKNDVNYDGFIDSVSVITTLANGTQITRDTTAIGSLQNEDALMRSLYQSGQVDQASYQTYASWSTSQLFSGTVTVSAAAWTPASGTSYDGKKAFYEASTKVDNSTSIANRTGVIIGSNNKGITSSALQALDTNQDGKLSGAELSSLQIWADANENGVLDTGELKTLASAGINQIASADYGFYTKGNSVWANTQGSTPAQTNLVQSVPNSNYRTMRDTDNTYWINSSQYIAFGTNQVKINNSNRTYLIGTDGNDSFDANYYAAYSAYFNNGLLTNFEAGAGDDVMGGSSRNDNLWGGTGNDTLFGYAGDDKLYGEEGNDQLQGNDGNDYLDGGIGNDTLFGQVGNDILVGGDGDDLLMGFTGVNEAQQTLSTGQTDNDYLYGGNGNDQLYGGLGDDYLDGGTGADNLNGGLGNDQLFGGSENDLLNGNEGDDQLSGDAGNDTLWGGVGNDILWGGDGNDTLMGFTPSNDVKQSLLAGESDNDIMYGGAGDDLILGGLGDDVLWGGIGADELQGGIGNDSLYGEDGNDRLFGGAGNDTIYGGAGDDLIFGGAATNETALASGTADSNFLYGGDGSDTIVGGIGNDYIDGGAGADNMQGGLGDDTYIVNSVNDVILEQQNEGYDTVVSSSNYMLNANIEELRLVEGFNINGTGNSLDNRIIGNSFDNILDGVTGADTLIGGLGNDTYVVDNRGDTVVELAGEGVDTVQSKISYTLGNNVENLTLLDFSNFERGIVNGINVLVYGYPKSNELDYMQGNAVAGYKGTCALTSIANLATESGIATTEAQVVQTAISNNWCVTDATKTDADRGCSNYVSQQALLNSYGIRNDMISGYNEQAVANLIKSGRGVLLAVNAGKLWGGNTNANYDFGVVDHVITITGAVYDAGSGALNGFYIADSGRGLVSDMSRYVSSADLKSAATVGLAYTLYTIDPIKLWEESINATGNGLDNVITGNRSNNILNGLAGNDALIGGLGNDTYVFGAGSGTDTIIDADSTAGNLDTISVGAGVAKEQLWFSQSGNDLVMSIIGTNDKDIIKDWFAGSQNQIEQIKLSNGNTLANAQVNTLVQAMAGYMPPAMGTTTLSTAYQANLAPVIAANWH
ncbi:calcium-binding protein [Polynucleobacter sp. JS-Safj-400b-B2]|nr:calcium-binding protein [Polynucleobacter sp. JS-Safj-400b-B2]